MYLKTLISWNYPLALLSAIALAPAPAIAATPAAEEAIKTLAAIPEDAEKFQLYCSILGEMANVPDGDEAGYNALEERFEKLIESYGPDLDKAWDVIEDIDPETEDGKAINTAFDVIDAKCP